MITANVLILNALKAIGIECEIGDSPNDGYYFNAGLSELNSLITELNIQDYLAEARKEKLVRAGGKIRIGDSADYEIREKEPPVNIKSLSRKMGLSYYKLVKCDKARIYSQSRTGLANLFTYNIEHDEDRHCMYGEIFTDGGMTSDFLVIYNKGFPQYKGDEKIWFSEMSINLLEEGLKYKLAQRFKLPDAQMFEESFKEYKHLVQEANGMNNPSTYYLGGGSYLDGYYNLLGGNRMGLI